MKCKSYNMFFEVIGSKTRMEILNLLMKKEFCVTDICKELKEEQSKISHNLRKLRQCHFINLKRNGKKRIYYLNKETIMPLMHLVNMHVHKYCNKGCALK